MTLKKRFLGGLSKQAKYVVLLDPDKLDEKSAPLIAAQCTEAKVDALFVGGSTGDPARFEKITRLIRQNSPLPLILFPGSAEQIVPDADGVLFMSLLSGRNPRFLIEEQLKGVPAIRQFNLPTLAMGYLLVESDKPTAVQQVSKTLPLRRDDIEAAVNHALAAQYLGMALIYLEAGSGATQTVPEEMIRAVKKALSIPLIVGGGIRTPEEAAKKVKAGADIIVTGNVLEKSGSPEMMARFADAVHGAKKI
ncbi:MAG: hypothetical protein A2293_01900 [Elusimicrobia bacterium RIFOXYB2_FULL_49_7]|nr:MAG: hypothetical protein A2293_01900 [Elusimicrobia bacterium RIFOXYB2_FULL_49_7]